MKKNPKISIIIPAYNDEQYLPNMLDCILSQSYTDFEVLVIDDGSDDNTLSVAESYVGKDSRIRVFHKENGGVSSARNLGIDNAMGEWLYMVDADDELYSDALSSFMQYVSEDIQLVIGGYERYDDNGDVQHGVENDSLFTLMNTNEAVRLLYHPLYSENYGYTWISLFRRDIIQRNKLRFNCNLAIKEDLCFYCSYVCCMPMKIAVFSKPVYKYFKRADSVTIAYRRVFNKRLLTSIDGILVMRELINKTFPEDAELHQDVNRELEWQVEHLYSVMRRSNVSIWNCYRNLGKYIKFLGIKYYKKLFNKYLNIFIKKIVKKS